MKNYFKKYQAFLLCIVATVCVQFVNKTATEDYTLISEIKTREYIIASSENITSQIVVLNEKARAFKAGEIDEKELQEQLKATRNAYKKIESILTYYYPEHVTAYINGAPLQHLDPYPLKEGAQKNNYYGSVDDYLNSVPLDKLETGHYKGENAPIIDPVGLQRLDEIIFTDEVFTSQDRIVELCKQLQVKYDVVEHDLNLKKYYYDFEVIESSRLELIRILGRGITGFDTPGSLNAMQETSSALNGIHNIVKPYITKTTPDLQKTLNELFKGGKKYLRRHGNFEKFDRFKFITTYLNPLYKELLSLQKELEIKSSAETYKTTPSWNAYTTNMFDDDFLNPYYYSMLKEKDDSPELRALGKKLFYDTSLSHNNTISCASCHNPAKAYTDGEKTSLAGIPGKRVLRNSPTLVNSVFSARYFYDLRAFDLEDQAEHVIENHMEFNTSFEDIVAGLNQNEEYTEHFKNIFGTAEINKYQFSSALASFVISLRSFNSEFDKYIRGEVKKTNKKVIRGFNLFMGKANCGTCHYAPTFSGLTPPLFQENESEVLGVLKSPDVLMLDNDLGRAGSNVFNEDKYIYEHSFKTTTVRNVALTAPYFHNGAYKTLDEVLDFYNKGGAAGVGLSQEVPNQTLSPDALGLAKSEIEDLKAFINALTDVPEE